jgi:hypothetical protein
VTAGGGELRLHIDELVLHGFDPRDRLAIGAAVERELARLLVGEGDSEGLSGGAAARVDGGSFDVAHEAPPGVVGVEIARAIHSGLHTPGAGAR